MVTADADAARRENLATFLRIRREELQPEDVGLARRGRRRVRGLRRHEVADLASVSVTWYTWLEQRRNIRVSPHALDSLARALKLSDDEWRHLRRLAAVPVVDVEDPRPHPNPVHAAMLHDLLPSAAYLTTASFDLLGWNQGYVELFGSDPLVEPPSRRNALWSLFMTDTLRTTLRDWQAETEEAVARFRAETGKYPGDARMQEVVDDLKATSEAFADAWRRQHVRRYTCHVQTFDHPEVGVIRTQLVQLRPLDQPSLTLSVHRPTDDASWERLARLVGADSPSPATA